jgi:hypothetical protein
MSARNGIAGLAVLAETAGTAIVRASIAPIVNVHQRLMVASFHHLDGLKPRSRIDPRTHTRAARWGIGIYRMSSRR